jgi:hypothetical protein
MSTIRRRGLMAAAILLALVGTAFVASPAQAAGTPIKHWQSGKCFDNAVEPDRFTWLQMWTCNGQSQQNFTRTLLSANDGTACCFEFRGDRRGTCITQQPSAGGLDMQPCLRDFGLDNATQRWRVWFAFNPTTGGGWYQQLQNVASGLCMVLPGNNSGNGAGIAVTTCDPFHGMEQRFRL